MSKDLAVVIMNNLYGRGNVLMSDIKECCTKNIHNIFQHSFNDISYIERCTIDQAQCSNWKCLRLGRITASTARQFKKCRNKTKFLFGKIHPQPKNIPALEYGIIHEKLVRDMLGAYPVGAFLLPEYPFILASPDALNIPDPWMQGINEIKVFEIKAPFSLRRTHGKRRLTLEDVMTFKWARDKLQQANTNVKGHEAKWTDFELKGNNLSVVNERDVNVQVKADSNYGYQMILQYYAIQKATKVNDLSIKLVIFITRDRIETEVGIKSFYFKNTVINWPEKNNVPESMLIISFTPDPCFVNSVVNGLAEDYVEAVKAKCIQNIGKAVKKKGIKKKSNKKKLYTKCKKDEKGKQ